MPWTCPNDACGALVALDSLTVCPTCREEKSRWTLGEHTRAFVLGRRRPLECRAGRTVDTREGAGLLHIGVAWQPTGRAAVVSKADALALRQARLLPHASDLLAVRLRPGPGEKRWRLTVSVKFETKVIEDHVLDFEPAPDHLSDDGHLTTLLLCVRGPEEMAGLDFPWVHVLDVSEPTDLGHAPRLEVGFPRHEPATVELVSTSAPRLTCERGAMLATREGASIDWPTPMHLGLAWREASELSVPTKEDARARRAAHLLPDAPDLLCARVVPGDAARWALTITVPFATRPAETLELDFAPDPALLGDDGALHVYLTCVRGAGELEGLDFPLVHVVDVTDGDGVAPRLELSSGACTRSVALTGGPARPRTLEARRGALVPTKDGGPLHLGLAWQATRALSVPTKEDARARRAARLLPDAPDLLCARLLPGDAARWTLTAKIERATGPGETVELELEPAPERLSDDGALHVYLLCVRGPGTTAGLDFPHVVVLDVSDGDGHAPRLTLTFAGGEPVIITLGSG